MRFTQARLQGMKYYLGYVMITGVYAKQAKSDGRGIFGHRIYTESPQKAVSKRAELVAGGRRILL